jgi:hypothetical protein
LYLVHAHPAVQRAGGHPAPIVAQCHHPGTRRVDAARAGLPELVQDNTSLSVPYRHPVGVGAYRQQLRLILQITVQLHWIPCFQIQHPDSPRLAQHQLPALAGDPGRKDRTAL